jgi:phosphopantetheinyl transferase (holo-ACP synthase)
MASHPDPSDWTALSRLCAELREAHTELAGMLRTERPFTNHDAAQRFNAKEAQAKSLRTQIEMIVARWPLSE